MTMDDHGRPLIRAVIVDDEPVARDVVRAMLAERADVVVDGEAADGTAAVDVIRRVRPDVVFLDIQMPDRDGFEVLEALGDETPPGVIFLTAHDEHAVRAFEVHALDYVLKPFGRPRFNAAVERAFERVRSSRRATLAATLESATARARSRAHGQASPDAELEPGTNGGADGLRRIGVRTGSKLTVVDVDAIDWIEAEGDYARLHAGRHSYLVSQRMQTLEQRLQSAGFVRAHRSVLVRADRVRELHRDADGSGYLVLSNGVRLRVARGRWDDLTRTLELDAL